MIEIKIDEKQRELTAHGTVQFPLVINHDCLYDFYERYIRCHWHEELELPVVIRGSIRYQLKEKFFELHVGEGLIINACIPHSAIPLEEDTVVQTIIFHPAFLYGTPTSSIYQSILYPYLNTPALAGIILPDFGIEAMKQVEELYQAKPFGYELQIKSILCKLFFDMLSPYQNLLASYKPSNAEMLSRLQILLDGIHNGYTEPLSLSELASRVSVSRESCSRFFKAMTGKTISQYLEDYRISQSILLLQEEQYSITQVSYMVGFGNPGRFSQAFARRMNCTPRQYRQKFITSQEIV